MFNAKKAKNECIEWMQQWYEANGKGCTIVIGISGGIDSSVVAALCVEAFGRDKVLGVILPNGEQQDIDDAYKLVDFLDIDAMELNINDAYLDVLEELSLGVRNISKQTKINLPARLRMTMLYAVSQSVNGRVANTCNLSENYVGYSTRYGDSVGDFAPIAYFTKGEVKALGKELGLLDELVEKIPEDGLSGKTDEENFGFSYDTLDKYIRTGICTDLEVKTKIVYLYEKNKFKLEQMPSFKFGGNEND